MLLMFIYQYLYIVINFLVLATQYNVNSNGKYVQTYYSINKAFSF